MGIGQAVEALKRGERLTRKGWDQSLQWVFLQKEYENRTTTTMTYHLPNGNSFVGEVKPYLCACYRRELGSAEYLPYAVAAWTPTLDDLLGEDWVCLSKESSVS